MPRQSSLTYEIVQAAAYRFLEEHGRPPKNKELRQEVGGESVALSNYMKIWRDEYDSAKKAQWSLYLTPIEAVISHSFDRGFEAKTKDLKERLQDAKDDADDLRSELGKTIGERDTAIDERDKARQNATNLEKERDDARKELSICRNDLSLARGENVRLHEKVGVYKTKFEAAEEENRALKEQAEADEEAKKEMAEELGRLRSRLRFLE